MNTKARAYKGYQRLSSQKKNKSITKVVTTSRTKNTEKSGTTGSRKKFHYFDKKNSLGSNLPITMRRKEAVDVLNRNTVSLLSHEKDSTQVITPKSEFLKNKSRVSLLGQYTSSAFLAKNRKGKCKLNRTKEISYPLKGGGSMYPLNISNHSQNPSGHKGQTMDLKQMKELDKSQTNSNILNLTTKLNKLKHSSTTKCLNDSIGNKMKNCLRNRNTHQESEKGIFTKKRRSQVNVLTQKTSPDRSHVPLVTKEKKNEIAKLHKKLKKASRQAKVIKSTLKNSRSEKV